MGATTRLTLYFSFFPPAVPLQQFGLTSFTWPDNAGHKANVLQSTSISMICSVSPCPDARDKKALMPLSAQQSLTD